MTSPPPEMEPTEPDRDTSSRDRRRHPSPALRAKKAFLAHMRHECRTPINAIIGYSELQLEDAVERGHSAFVVDLQRIRSCGHELLSLVNGILDPAGIEASTDIDMEEFGVHMRHALRTPINSVIGYVDLLMEEAGDQYGEDLVPDLQRIKGAANNLLALISDILSLWQIQGGKKDIEVSTDMFQVIQDAMTAIRPLGESQAILDATGGSLLVVDDNAVNRDLLCRRLERDGHRVWAAENGRQAMELLRTGNFDLVLLDILMPEMNGYEVLTQIRSSEGLKYIPVIMLSSLDEVDSVVRCIEMGADDYLPKPFNSVLLKARIGACLEKKRLRDREQAYLEQLQTEREKSERLLLNILPMPIAERLKQGERPIADTYAEVTVLFADLVGFTQWSALEPPAELIESLNRIFSAFDRLAEEHGLEKIKTIGDAYMAVAGLPMPRPDHVEAAAGMALDMLEAIAGVRRSTNKRFRLRVGMNTGPVVAGVIGTKKFIYDLWGDTVNTASRMESHSMPDEILVTAEVYERLRDRYVFKQQPPLSVKGKGRMQTYLLKGKVSRLSSPPVPSFPQESIS
ncbi:MAG: response regulator [Chloroflexi bacterium]|nr:response regulator [Chloroflexota bacterium]